MRCFSIETASPKREQQPLGSSMDHGQKGIGSSMHCSGRLMRWLLQLLVVVVVVVNRRKVSTLMETKIL